MDTRRKKIENCQCISKQATEQPSKGKILKECCTSNLGWIEACDIKVIKASVPAHKKYAKDKKEKKVRSTLLKHSIKCTEFLHGKVL